MPGLAIAAMWVPAIILFGTALVILTVWARQRLASLQKRVEALQRENEEMAVQAKIKRQTLFDGMTEGVLVLDLEGRVEFVNLALRRMAGFTTDIRGKAIQEALPQRELGELIERVSMEGQVVGAEMEIANPVPRCLQINAAAFYAADGRREGTLVVFHDVTRLKQLENVRKEFVANVSHELRTPVSLIKGFAETLLSEKELDPEQHQRYLRTIEKHADRLTFLIEDLLTISRLESGKAVMNLETTAVWGVAERVREDLRARAAERKVVIENLVPTDLWAQADADRLHQVLCNLVENAIKYGRSGGSVAVHGKKLAQKKVQIWVQDDGPGIPPEAKERVFERFYRVDRARSRETGGTGLGLTIVKHIVQAHGGEVWLQSEAGRGATFFFTLPQN